MNVAFINQRYLAALMMVVWLFSVGCSGSKKSGFFHKKTELEELNETLPIEVKQQDNLKLYQLVAAWYGVPHRDGGCDRSGTDCSCFIKMVVSEVYGKTLPRNSAEMFKNTARIDSTELKEGDLVFFNTKSDRISHVGIYLKDRKFAHVSTSKGVAINSLTENYYRKYYAGGGKMSGD